MKNFAFRIAFALVFLVTTAATVRAQAADVVSGTLTISLDPTLWATLETHGIATTLGPAVANVPHADTILSGLFDLESGKGTLATKGQMKMTGPDGQVVTVLQLGVDATGPVTVITGSVYANNYYYGRQVIFTVLQTSFGKMEPKMGANKGMMCAQLSPYFLGLLGRSFNTSILLGYRGVSMMSTSMVLGPA